MSPARSVLVMLEVGLIDEGWCDRLSAELAGRLRDVIETRERER